MYLFNEVEYILFLELVVDVALLCCFDFQISKTRLCAFASKDSSTIIKMFMVRGGCFWENMATFNAE